MWSLPDFDAYPTNHRIRAADVVAHGVRLQWDDGLTTEHHRLVLREHSPDPLTTHPQSREQQIQLADLAPGLEIVAAGVDGDGGLWVDWSEGAVERSVFHPGWLRHWAHETRGADHALAAPVVWHGDVDLAALRFDGVAISAGDPLTAPEFERWLQVVHTHGLGVVSGLPVETSTIHDIAERVGPVRRTNFGEAFDVRTKASDITSNAYTDLELPVHTDLDTREYMPGLQFLFCLVADARGGESRLADGMAITRHLRDNEPGAFDALTTIPVLFMNKAVDTDYRHESPFLVVDDDGELVEARWSPWLRGPLDATITEAERFYRALRLAFEMADDDRFRVAVRLEPGDLLAFDNRRVLHGRGPIDRSTGERWLRGCYVEREELHSRLRILARRRRERVA